MRVRNYELSNDGVLLYISHNGKQYYTEYTPEIEDLLASGILGSFSNNGKRGGYYPKFDLGPSKLLYKQSAFYDDTRSLSKDKRRTQ